MPLIGFGFLFLIICVNLNFSSGELQGDLASHHVTGNMRIKRSSVPEAVLHCLSKNGSDVRQLDEAKCPSKNTPWNNIHCINNSFGMYASGSKFLKFGQGPIGVSLCEPFFGIFSGCSKTPPGPSHVERLEKKIETLIEDKTKLQVNTTYLLHLLAESKREQEDLRSKLEESVKKVQWQKNAMQVMQYDILRWREGSVECRGNILEERNQTTAALEIATQRIKQLENDNQKYAKINQKLSESLRDAEEVLERSRNKSSSCGSHLGTCKTTLQLCEESSKRTQELCEGQQEDCDAYTKKCQNNYESLRTKMTKKEIYFVEVTTKLAAASRRNKVLEDSRNKCLDNLAKKEEDIAALVKRLSQCHTKYNRTTNQETSCRDDMKECSEKVLDLKKQNAKCSENSKISENELNNLQRKEREMKTVITTLTSQIHSMEQITSQLQGKLGKLIVSLNEEKDAHSETKAMLSSCKVDLGSFATKLKVLEEHIAEANEEIEQLRTHSTTLTKGKNTLHKQLMLLRNKSQFLLTNLGVCQNQLKQHQAASESLQVSKGQCQEKLHEAQNMLRVTLEQRNACHSKNNFTLGKIDLWKKQYLISSNKSAALQMQVQKLLSDLKSWKVTYDLLKEETKAVYETNQNLQLRLDEATDVTSQMSSTVSRLQKRLTDAEDDKDAMNEHLQNVIRKKEQLHVEYMLCMKNHNETVGELHDLTLRCERVGSELAIAKELSTQTAIQLNRERQDALSLRRLLTTAQNQITKLEASLNATRALYENEQKMKETISKRLLLCTSNHTEAEGEVAKWQNELRICQDAMNNIIKNHKAETLHMQTQMYNCSESQQDAQSTIEQNERLLAEQRSTIANCEKDKENMGLTIHELNEKKKYYEIRIDYILNIKMRLAQRLELCNEERIKANRLVEIYQDRKQRCEKDMVRLHEDMDVIHKELEECNLNCHQANLACPRGAKGEVFINTYSGCLLQTHQAVDQRRMHSFCRESGGSLLTLPAQNHSILHDIKEMLEMSDIKPSQVWVQRPGQSSNDCFSVDMAKLLASSSNEVKFVSTRCTKELPGICISKWTKYEAEMPSASERLIEVNFNSTSSDIDIFDASFLGRLI